MAIMMNTASQLMINVELLMNKLPEIMQNNNQTVGGIFKY